MAAIGKFLEGRLLADCGAKLFVIFLYIVRRKVSFYTTLLKADLPTSDSVTQ
jgi:hypothetical protein